MLRPDPTSESRINQIAIGHPYSHAEVNQVSDNIQTIKDLYAAFGRGDVPTILAALSPDVSWEVEAPAEISIAGIRKGPEAVKGFFQAIAADHGEPKLEIAEYLSSADAVATFGRYKCTVKKTGKYVDS